LTKLTADQLTKVLENPELFNLPRIKELREKAAQADKLKADQAKAEEDKLTTEKKFEELATKRADELAAANATIEKMTIDQALTNKLVGEKVVDLDGALKLVDRSKLSVDNGQVVGVDEALTSLRTDRAYLFTEGSAPAQPSVGTPSNPAAPAAPSGQYKFKESQLTPQFYQEHKAEVDAAGAAGLIEPDGPPQV
jgi:hypothetical protein